MKQERRWRLFGATFSLWGLVLFGGSIAAWAKELKLVPEPKQVERREGAFRVTRGVRIALGSAHAREDRIAAEMLAGEIQAATGQKPGITTSREVPSSTDVIYLGRIGDDHRLRAALAARGLTADETFDPEGYLLDADRGHVWVAGTTGQGLFYGVQTLRQLLHPAEGPRGRKEMACPALRIKDWPAMRWRGLHEDISRGPVPTLAYMKEQVRTIAEYKMNLFALYIEHIFDYRSQPLVAPKEGALTAAELQELVAYARRYYVTLLPEQQVFGHLHHVFKHEVYSDLAETPHGHVLAPGNERSYELIRQLYAELAPLSPGPFLHIGSDETWELGTGQTQAKAQAEGLGQVYLEHLKRVAEMLRPYHKRLLFWADIAARYPELLRILPKEMIAVPWAYDPRPSFDALIEPFKKAGLEFFVAPGASNWDRIFPDLNAALVNIRNFSRDGQKFGALGMLNTAWDDDGEALLAMTWPAVVFGAACAWQAGESSIEAFQAKYDWVFYRNDDRTFQDTLDHLAWAHSLLPGKGPEGASDEAFWLDPFTEAGARSIEKTLPAAHGLRMEAERVLDSLYRHRAKAQVHADTLDALIFAAERLDALGMKIQFVSESSAFYRDAYKHQGEPGAAVAHDLSRITGTNGRLEDLRDSLTRLRAAYSDLWLKENRPYWLGDVLIRYDWLLNRYQSQIASLRQAQYLHRAGVPLPAPEALGFYLKAEP